MDKLEDYELGKIAKERQVVKALAIELCLMSYKLKLLPSANKEWDKLDNSIKVQFINKLKKCLESSHFLPNKLRDIDSAYKLKLRAAKGKIMPPTIKLKTEFKPIYSAF